MSDRLPLTDAIEDAGLARPKVERLASVILDVIHDTVATKADLAEVRSALKADRQPSVMAAHPRRFQSGLDRMSDTPPHPGPAMPPLMSPARVRDIARLRAEGVAMVEQLGRKTA